MDTCDLFLTEDATQEAAAGGLGGGQLHVVTGHLLPGVSVHDLGVHPVVTLRGGEQKSRDCNTPSDWLKNFFCVTCITYLIIQTLKRFNPLDVISILEH